MSEFMGAIGAKSAQASQDSLRRTWELFHESWFGRQVEALPLTPGKVYAICSMIRAGGYRAIDNYLARMKDAHVEHGYAWDDQLARAFRRSRRAVTRGIGPARQSAALSINEAFAAFNGRLELEDISSPVGLRSLFIAGSFWMLRELEISCAKVSHVHVDDEACTVDWILPSSKTDAQALGTARRWECVCGGDRAQACPYHAIVEQLSLLKEVFGVNFSENMPLFPNRDGSVADKRQVVAGIECIAALTGQPLVTETGVRRFGGHSLRVSGAQDMARRGVHIAVIQLMARWSSDIVLRYVSEVPLEGLSESYRRSISDECTSSSADLLGRLQELQARLEGDRLFLTNYRHEKLAREEPHKSDDAKYILNDCSQVLHRPLSFSLGLTPRHWRTVCGWGFGDARYEATGDVPVGASRCAVCFRGCAASPSGGSSSSSSD